MNCKDYILYIRKEIQEKKEYDEYVHGFKEYLQYLQKRLLDNSEDVEAVCQYCATLQELRCPGKECAELMEKMLQHASDRLTPFEKMRLHTNLAGIYEFGETCMEHLREAVRLNQPIPNAYDALGRIYMQKKEFKFAESLCLKAVQVSDRPIYRYNYAVSLYQSNKIEQAKNILLSLLSQIPTDRDIWYSYAVCCHFTGDSDQAVAILDALADLTAEDNDILEHELADLYFLCGRYREHNAMIDRAHPRLARECGWIFFYLYALKRQGDIEELQQKYQAFLQEIKRDSEYIENEPLNDDFSQKEKDRCIARYRQEAQELCIFYEKLYTSDFIPEKTITLCCKNNCYMLDCPRHQDVLEYTDLS